MIHNTIYHWTVSWLLLLYIESVIPFFPPKASVVFHRSFLASSFDDLSREELKIFRSEESHRAVIEALVNAPSSLLQVYLVGQTELATSKNVSTPCLVITNQLGHDTPRDSLCLPITPRQLKLLSFAVQDVPLSKSVLLGLNSLLLNRDDGLFDNLPWATWTVDPMRRNRDSAFNFIDEKFHSGKRDAYNVMMGKDWKGRSISIGNLAMRAKYMMSRSESKDEAIELTARILELQVKDLQMAVAECDYELAIARQQSYDEEEVNKLVREKQGREVKLQNVKISLQSSKSISNLSFLLDQIVQQTTKNGDNTAPYRGATGYAPLVDSQDDLDQAILPYSSPFHLMKEIIETQLQAQVIGSIFENTSLLTGNQAVGGAVILQRTMPKKSLSIGGEILSVDDENEDYGNEVIGGEIFVVECNVDEAVGMALASKTTIQMENELWNLARVVVLPVETMSSDFVLDALPRWEPRDKTMSFLVEGQSRNQSTTEQVSPLRIPRTTTSLFDSLFEARSPQNQKSPSYFPSDNPIQTLEQFDELDNSGKALTLLSLSNFNGKLPRPRVLRQSGSNPLDKLLLPLIDESVRRQYLIRDAEKRGDFDEVRTLESEKSRRQQAKEMAEVARVVGDDGAADRWLQKAEFYGNLRADVTQDEGSYSRFLDRDELYEQNLQALANRNKKMKFGKLLDGIE